MNDRGGNREQRQLDAGREALRRGDWEAARAAFEADIAAGVDCGEAWEGLGFACSWLQDVPRLFEARQEAYRRYRADGDARSAARMATWLASDCLEFRGEAAVAAGWLERARELLEGVERSLEYAFLREIEAHMVLAVRRDPVAARAAAVEAYETAHQLGDLDHEICARAIEGLALVTAGDISDGMRRLDTAAAAALGGDMADLTAISVTCCSVIQACMRVHDFDRANQWCNRFREFATRWRLGTFLTFCRLQYAMVLVWRGDWDAAEAELLTARDELESARPAIRPAALVRLGELRRRQGRWEEAAQLLEEARAHPLAALWRGALALDRGDVVTAEELADQFLRRAPADRDAERLAALELRVRALAARGADAEAASNLEALETLAAAIGTAPVRGSALFAAGALALARKQAEDARRLLADAADLYASAGLPFEEARARLELACVLLALGRAAPAAAEARSALAALERLGAEREAERARQLLQQLAGSAQEGHAVPPAAQLTRRQREVLQLVAQGLSNRQIAERLFLSEFTVRRHLSNIYLRLGVPSRAAAVAQAFAEGVL